MDQRSTWLEQLANSQVAAWAVTHPRDSLQGKLRLDTRNTVYRFLDGFCYAATRYDGTTSERLRRFVGMRLIGWVAPGDSSFIEEWSLGAYAVLWRPGRGEDDEAAFALTSSTCHFAAEVPARPPPLPGSWSGNTPTPRTFPSASMAPASAPRLRSDPPPLPASARVRVPGPRPAPPTLRPTVTSPNIHTSLPRPPLAPRPAIPQRPMSAPPPPPRRATANSAPPRAPSVAPVAAKPSIPPRPRARSRPAIAPPSSRSNARA